MKCLLVLTHPVVYSHAPNGQTRGEGEGEGIRHTVHAFYT